MHQEESIVCPFLYLKFSKKSNVNLRFSVHAFILYIHCNLCAILPIDIAAHLWYNRLDALVERKLVTKTAILSSSLVKKLTKKIYQNPLTSDYLYAILCIKKRRKRGIKT